MTNQEFQRIVTERGHELWRDMPWRDDTQPYYVLISELMLQQTQVARVVPKFLAFVAAFPDVKSLAAAELGDVLKLWQGLGYNRRAKYLHDSARMVLRDFDGTFPHSETDLRTLPGVGKNTAGAICAYAYNRPVLFVETNVRTVYIHHFFADDFAVTDTQICAKLEQTIDRENPRRFYQALMDYGTWLKRNGVKNNTRSKHYRKQAPLDGSLRQMRGEIVRRITSGRHDWRAGIEDDPRFQLALDGLRRDGLVGQAHDNI